MKTKNKKEVVLVFVFVFCILFLLIVSLLSNRVNLFVDDKFYNSYAKKYGLSGVGRFVMRWLFTFWRSI